MAGMALVGGGTVLATYGWGVLQDDASWHMIGGITLVVAGVAVFLGGVILLFRLTSIPAPGRLPDDTNAHTDPFAESLGYTDIGTLGGHGHHQGGGHDGGAGGNN